MRIKDFEGGFFVEGLTGKRCACVAEAVFRAACGADDGITGRTDFFLSMYQFPATFVEQIRSTGKTAGYAGACWSRFLWFDIDREGDLTAAMRDAARLADFLVCGRTDNADSAEVEPENIQAENVAGVFVPGSESVSLWFSGAKGFHVGVPMAVFGNAAEASPAFPSQCKAVAVEVARLAGVEIDAAVYDRVRLFRCPNTKHAKTGLYKIPVSYWELTAVRNLAVMLDWAKSPRRQVVPPADNLASVAFRADVPKMPAAAELWRRVVEPVAAVVQPTEKAHKDTDKQTVSPVTCQTQTLPESGQSVPRLRRETFEFIRQGAKRGERAVSLFRAAADCTRCGWSRDAVFSLLPDVARDAGLNGYEAESQINAGIMAGGKRGEA